MPHRLAHRPIHAVHPAHHRPVVHRRPAAHRRPVAHRVAAHRPAHMVKGSAAAKAHMARLRAMRR